MIDMANVMVDLETLATGCDNKAVVVSIGLVRFNLFDEDTWETIEADPTRTYYTVLPIEPQIDAGRSVEAGALLWWIQQVQTGHPNISTIFSPLPQCANLEAPEREQVLVEKLTTISEWLDSDTALWGKPAHFDCPKVESLLKTFGVKMPVPWFNYRCMSGARTAAKVIGTQKPKFHTKGNQDHHALWDAVEQTLELQGWLRNMRSGLRV